MVCDIYDIHMYIFDICMIYMIYILLTCFFNLDFLQIILIPFVLFLSGNCGKEGKALQKFEYLENKKSFFDETKNTFDSFGRAII